MTNQFGTLVQCEVVPRLQGRGFWGVGFMGVDGPTVIFESDSRDDCAAWVEAWEVFEAPSGKVTLMPREIEGCGGCDNGECCGGCEFCECEAV